MTRTREAGGGVAERPGGQVKRLVAVAVFAAASARRKTPSRTSVCSVAVGRAVAGLALAPSTRTSFVACPPDRRAAWRRDPAVAESGGGVCRSDVGAVIGLRSGCALGVKRGAGRR